MAPDVRPGLVTQIAPEGDGRGSKQLNLPDPNILITRFSDAGGV